MYTRYKFLTLFFIGVISAVACMFLIAIQQENTPRLFWISAWAVSVGLAIFGTNGYADSKAQAAKGCITGMMLDQMASAYGLKRRRAGWEFDSTLRARLCEAVRLKFPFAKSIEIYDRETKQ